jgi:hypothetical protein
MSELERTVRKAIEKDRNERFQAIQDAQLGNSWRGPGGGNLRPPGTACGCILLRRFATGVRVTEIRREITEGQTR